MNQTRNLQPATPTTRMERALRIFAHELLCIWLYLLEYRATSLSRRLAANHALHLACREKFRRRNLEFQEKLREVFVPVHHLCRDCGFCCGSNCDPRYRIPVIPFNMVDKLLYGLGDKIPVAEIPFQVVLYQVAALSSRCLRFLFPHRQINQGQEEDDPQPYTRAFCLALDQDGCRLPWGARPTVCVLHICWILFQGMNWPEYWGIMRGLFQYLCHLTRFLRTVAAETRQLTPGPASHPMKFRQMILTE